jgi:hypothetical protein
VELLDATQPLHRVPATALDLLAAAGAARGMLLDGQVRHLLEQAVREDDPLRARLDRLLAARTADRVGGTRASIGRPGKPRGGLARGLPAGGMPRTRGPLRSSFDG